MIDGARSPALRTVSLAAGVTALYGAAAFAIFSLPLRADDVHAVALLAATPLLLFGLYVVANGVLGDRLFGALTAIVYIFIAAAVFRVRDYDDKSIDFQVAAKLAAFGIIFITNTIFFSFALRRIRLPRLFFVWLVFFCALIVCSLYAVKLGFALTCTVLFLFCYLYAVYMTMWLSRLTAIQVMMAAALLLCIGSIFVYYAIPSIGVMQAWTPEAGFGEIGRMKGLTGSANGIGFIAAFALLLSVLYFRSFGTVGKLLAVGLVPSALVCLILSDNRSSMIAVVASIWLSIVFRRHVGAKLLVSVTLGLVGLAILAAFPDQIFAMLSRSGNPEEITSVTGRSAIWSVVIQMWLQRPLYGYGYTSALAILPLDPRLFHVAAHAHNMYLELLFAGGLILLTVFLFAVAQTVLAIVRLRAVNEAALLFFFMLRGLTEATPFSGMVGFSSLAFTLTVALVIAQLAAARRFATVPARRLSPAGAVPMLQQSRS